MPVHQDTPRYASKPEYRQILSQADYLVSLIATAPFSSRSPHPVASLQTGGHVP